MRVFFFLLPFRRSRRSKKALTQPSPAKAGEGKEARSPLISIALSLAILGVSVAALLAAIALVRQVARRWRWTAEVQRKSVHIAIGLYALTLPVLFDAQWPVIALIMVALALMLFLRTPASRATGLGSVIHSVERRSAGDIWLALAIGFVFVQSEGSYILYALPIAVIALSDAAAALTGSSYGRTRYAVEEGVKSWEGIIAFFTVTLIVAMVMLLLLTDVGRVNVILLALAIAAFGALVEAVSWRGLDNLFVPVCVHFFLVGYLNATPLELLTLALTFFGTIAVVAWIAPRIGLSPHASRAMSIAIFFFLAVVGPYGTILPLLLVAAHLVARTRQPCRSPHCDLDFVATLAGVGLIWLFVGETVGPRAVNLYNLALAGMLLGYLIVAIASRRAHVAALWLWIFALFLVLVGVGPADLRWVTALSWIAGGSLALVAVATAIRRELFDRWRAPRLAAAASVVPMSAYLYQTVIA